MSKIFKKNSPDRLTPEEIKQWRHLKKALDSMNQWEKQQQLMNRGQESPQQRFDEFLDLMDFVLRFAPAESEKGFKERMLHLIEFQNKLLTFERWRLGKQVD